MQWLKLVYVKKCFISAEAVHQQKRIFCQYSYFWSYKKIQQLHCVVLKGILMYKEQ